MLTHFFRQKRHQRLTTALKNGDTDTLARLLPKHNRKTLCEALEIALYANQPAALRLLIQAGASLNNPAQNALLDYPFTQPNTLVLLKLLLQAGAHIKDREAHLLELGLQHCQPSDLPQLLDCLQNAGMSLEQTTVHGIDAMTHALQNTDRPLLNYLIASGAALPDPWPAGVSDEIIQFAKRRHDDQKIQQAFLTR